MQGVIGMEAIFKGWIVKDWTERKDRV